MKPHSMKIWYQHEDYCIDSWFPEAHKQGLPRHWGCIPAYWIKMSSKIITLNKIKLKRIQETLCVISMEFSWIAKLFHSIYSKTPLARTYSSKKQTDTALMKVVLLLFSGWGFYPKGTLLPLCFLTFDGFEFWF